MEESAAVILKIDLCLFEGGIDELENFEADSVFRGHVCELEFLQRLAVNGEYWRIGRLGALYVHDLAADNLEAQCVGVPFGDGIDVVDRDGDVVDRAGVSLRVLILSAFDVAGD